MIFFDKNFLATKSKFWKILKIDTILYTFYSEFYTDSEFVTFFRFTSKFWEKSTVKVWPESQKLVMVTVFYGPNRLILIKVTQGRYWAAMLGSGEVGASMFWSVPVSRNRRNCCIISINMKG